MGNAHLSQRHNGGYLHVSEIENFRVGNLEFGGQLKSVVITEK